MTKPMTDYTQLANEMRNRARDNNDYVNNAQALALADALLACQRERDAHAEGHLACSERLTRRIAELKLELDELAAAIWGEPQPGMTQEETCRQAVDQRVAFDAIDAVKAERDRLRAERDRLAAEVERLRAERTGE